VKYKATYQLGCNFLQSGEQKGQSEMVDFFYGVPCMVNNYKVKVLSGGL